MHKRYLYGTVFFSGMTTLAVELAASRLLGNVFGTSNLVWASIIGLILVYLTVGYSWGGAWADRSPHAETMYAILAWGAFSAGVIPLAAKPVLRFAASAFDALQMGVLAGSFVTVLILFSLPVTLLGMISPFAIRLAIHQSEEAGRVSGRVYAISTLGSFVGTFLPVLVLIPWVGTTRTFLFFSALLLTVALGGLWQSLSLPRFLPYLALPLILGLLAWWGLASPLKSSANQIYETESAYNYIQVLEKDGYRYLRLNDGQGVHSEYHPTELKYYGPWMQFLAAPFFNAAPFDPHEVKRIAIVGLAAGTVARQASAVFGALPIDGFEIDPRIIQIGQQYFGMTMPNLNAIAQDGRWGLAHSQNIYSLIIVDAYRPPYIPWHLTTREFFQITRDHLGKNGVLAINVGRSPEDRRLINAMAATISAVYPSVYVMDVPYTLNSIIYATAQPTTLVNLVANQGLLAARQDVHPLLKEAVFRTLSNIAPAPEPAQVFTDDRAPIEWITNTMILNFILQGDLEILQ